MAEIKRVFQGGKMERDVDDRLVKNGDYRYANNVNVGESEGGDVGALENLKGNELIPGQEDIVGTTIGSVRDPNNDKIYWFTTSDETNAIYEYDGTEVRTILKDDASRPNPKPTCVPDFTTDINEPVSDSGARDDLNFNFRVPVGGCMDSTANNYVPDATFQEGTCTFDPVGDTDDPTATIAGGQIAMPGGTITFTGGISLGQQLGVANTLLAGSQRWTVSDVPNELPTTIVSGGGDGDGSVAFSVPVSVSGDVTVTFSFMVTQDDASVISSNVASRVGTFTAAQTFEFAATSVLATPDARVTVSGGVPSEQGIMGVPEDIGWISTLAITDPTAFMWATNPTHPTIGLPTNFITFASDNVAGTTDTASVTYSGSWNPTGNVDVVTTWGGFTLEAAPVPFACSATAPTPGSFLNIGNIATSPVPPAQFFPTFATYVFTITGPVGAVNTANPSSTPASGFRFVTSEPSSSGSGITAGADTPPGNYTVTAVATNPTNGDTLTCSDTFTIQAPIVPDFTFSLPNGFPTSVVRGSTGNSFLFRIHSNFVATGVQASLGFGGGVTLTSPSNPAGETFPNPGSLAMGNNDFTVTFDVTGATITEIIWNANATNRDPFEAGQGPVNANAFSSEIPGADANGIFRAPVVEA